MTADGKVYLGDEDGDVAILEAGRKMKLFLEITPASSIYTTPKGHDGILYIACFDAMGSCVSGCGRLGRLWA